MVRRTSHRFAAVPALVLAVATFALTGAQASAATAPPTMRPMQIHIVQPQLAAPCPAGTGIVVTPAGGRPFTAQSVAFEDTTVLSDSVEKTITRSSSGRVTVVKLADESSADLYHALTRSSELSTVTIVMHGESGNASHGTIVTLAQVTVVGFDSVKTPSVTTTSATREKVTFSYRQLTRSTCGG